MKQITVRHNQNELQFQSEFDRVLFEKTVVAPEGKLWACWEWEFLRSNDWFGDSDLVKGFIVWQKAETDVEQIVLCLKHHDWTYDYSDEYRVVLIGEAERQRIYKLMKQVGMPLGIELYNKYCPHEEMKKDIKWTL